MRIFDSHTHIDDKCFDKDRRKVIDRAAKQGVCAIMIAGIDATTSQKAIHIAKANKQVVTSVGLHPHYAKNCTKTLLETLISLAENNACVKAWGETGLDFNRMFSPKTYQEHCFEKQLEAAGLLDLPLIFHERDSQGRFYQILKSTGPKTRKGVIHCFSGDKDALFKYLDLGYYIGITGILTIKKRGQYLREIAPLIPDNRIVIETDAPYLTPAPQKNKCRRNEPGFVKSVLLKLAEIKKADPEILAGIIYKNTLNLYDI